LLCFVQYFDVFQLSTCLDCMSRRVVRASLARQFLQINSAGNSRQ
jgi:hypothetical protein